MAILWTVRLACVCYATSVAAGLTGRRRLERWLWIAGLIAYLGHVWAAFAIEHHWSHQAAYEETARQTGELFGIRSGAGIYFNYVFTAVWVTDVVAGKLRERSWWRKIVQGFFAFMFFHAVVVFATGWTRWLGVAATIGLGVLWVVQRRSGRS